MIACRSSRPSPKTGQLQKGIKSPLLCQLSYAGRGQDRSSILAAPLNRGAWPRNEAAVVCPACEREFQPVSTSRTGCSTASPRRDSDMLPGLPYLPPGSGGNRSGFLFGSCRRSSCSRPPPPSAGFGTRDDTLMTGRGIWSFTSWRPTALIWIGRIFENCGGRCPGQTSRTRRESPTSAYAAAASVVE